MGEKIGEPLTIVKGQPRVLPKTLPRPVAVPAEAPVREKVPVKAWRAAVMKAMSERSYAATERVIGRLASFLGITEQQVVDPIITIIDTLTLGLKKLTPQAKTPSA